MNKYFAIVAILFFLCSACVPQYESVTSGPRAGFMLSAPALTSAQLQNPWAHISFYKDEGTCSITKFMGNISLDVEKTDAKIYVAANKRLYVKAQAIFASGMPSAAYFSFIPEVDRDYTFMFVRVGERNQFVIKGESPQGEIALQSWSVCQNVHDTKKFHIEGGVVGSY